MTISDRRVTIPMSRTKGIDKQTEKHRSHKRLKMITLKNRPARKNTNSRKNTAKKVETMNATANENTLFSHALNATFE